MHVLFDVIAKSVRRIISLDRHTNTDWRGQGGGLQIYSTRTFSRPNALCEHTKMTYIVLCVTGVRFRTALLCCRRREARLRLP